MYDQQNLLKLLYAAEYKIRANVCSIFSDSSRDNIFCDFFGMTIDKVIGVMQNSRVNR